MQYNRIFSKLQFFSLLISRNDKKKKEEKEKGNKIKANLLRKLHDKEPK